MLNRRVGEVVDEDPKPDLSPMIDCVFILLIFFIVTAVFVEEDGLDYRMPEEAAPAMSQVDNKTVLILISAENVVTADGRNIGIDGVQQYVESKVSINDDAPVVVQSAAKASHRVVTAVQNECRKAVEADKLTMISK